MCLLYIIYKGLGNVAKSQNQPGLSKHYYFKSLIYSWGDQDFSRGNTLYGLIGKIYWY